MLLLLLLTSILSAQGKDRMCCRYRCAPKSAPSECASWCTTRDSCILQNGTDMVHDESCRVVYDTKKDQTSVSSKEECLQKNFRSRNGFTSPPFYLVPYVYKRGVGDIGYTGLDLRYHYSSFKNLRFRFKNTNHNICPEHSGLVEESLCNPRCVEITQMNRTTPWAYGNTSFLSYDCEVGFYISEKPPHKSWIGTTGHDYILSICVDTFESSSRICGEYTFKVPSPQEVEDNDTSVIVIFDQKEFENHDKIVIFVPTLQTADRFLVSLLLHGENKSTTEVHKQIVQVPSRQGPTMRILVDYTLISGRYQVAVTPLRGKNLIGGPSFSAFLNRGKEGEYALTITTSLLCFATVVGLLLGLYKRWQQVADEVAIEPSALVKAGKLTPRPLLVISSIDVMDHAQIVKDLCCYLKEWCGVGDIYYPLDDELGIHCGHRDPWKWAQNSYDSVRENGTILFIAGPDPSLAESASLYPGIQDNQAFLLTQDMRMLSDQGRLLIVKFPYSDMKTLPTLIPQHLVKSALLLPDKMNAFLSLLLRVRKKALCSLIPVPLVQPNILPKDLTQPGGPLILQKLQQLTMKAKARNSEEKEQEQNEVIERFLPPTDIDGSSSKLNQSSYAECYPGKKDFYSLHELLNETNEERLHNIPLEETLPSVNFSMSRDRSMADDLMD